MSGLPSHSSEAIPQGMQRLIGSAPPQNAGNSGDKPSTGPPGREDVRRYLEVN
jgi:hypothetical protein